MTSSANDGMPTYTVIPSWDSLLTINNVNI